MNPNTTHDSINHTIDRALAGIRDAQPRSGLNGRILATLEHRTDALGGPSFRAAKGWGIARGSARENGLGLAHVAVWAATSAAVLAIASLIVLHREAIVPAQHSTKTVILSEARSAQSKDPDAARRPTTAKPFSTANLAVANIPAEPTHRMAHPAHATMPAPCAQGCPVHDDGADVVMSGVTTVAEQDAQALADLHAPSHPAPPLPLTPEEKLFRRMTQYRNATQLAELDPVVRAKENADETTAFKAFFPDPPPLKQPGDDE